MNIRAAIILSLFSIYSFTLPMGRTLKNPKRGTTSKAPAKKEELKNYLLIPVPLLGQVLKQQHVRHVDLPVYLSGYEEGAPVYIRDSNGFNENNAYIINTGWVLIYNNEIHCWEKYPRMEYYFNCLARGEDSEKIIFEFMKGLKDRQLLNTPARDLFFYGKRPLVVAAIYINLPAIDCLLKQGADPRLLDENDKTPLDYCAMIEKRFEKSGDTLESEVREFSLQKIKKIREKLIDKIAELNAQDQELPELNCDIANQ